VDPIVIVFKVPTLLIESSPVILNTTYARKPARSFLQAGGVVSLGYRVVLLAFAEVFFLLAGIGVSGRSGFSCRK
jgi:hypothetical protein